MQYVSRTHHYIGNRRQENNGLGRIGVSGQVSSQRLLVLDGDVQNTDLVRLNTGLFEEVCVPCLVNHQALRAGLPLRCNDPLEPPVEYPDCPSAIQGGGQIITHSLADGAEGQPFTMLGPGYDGEHESLDYKTPGEKANVSAPFSEWEDVVKASPPDDRPRVRNLRETRARLADAEMPELREWPGVKFVGFKEPRRRGSRSPLVRTPNRKVSPPAGKGGVKAAAIQTKPNAAPSKAKVKTRQAHTYAKTRRAVQRSQRQGR